MYWILVIPRNNYFEQYNAGFTIDQHETVYRTVFYFRFIILGTLYCDWCRTTAFVTPQGEELNK